MQDQITAFFGAQNAWLTEFVFIVFVLSVWSLFWKGMALWKAAQRREKGWFIVLLIVNTVGLLEILYLYVFSKKRNKS